MRFDKLAVGRDLVYLADRHLERQYLLEILPRALNNSSASVCEINPFRFHLLIHHYWVLCSVWLALANDGPIVFGSAK
jgi:hypothetical protein